MFTPQIPADISGLGRSRKSTCCPSGCQKGSTQQPPEVNWRRPGTGVGEGSGLGDAVGSDVGVTGAAPVGGKAAAPARVAAGGKPASTGPTSEQPAVPSR